MSERVDLQEFIGAFVIEAEEIVATATAALLEIELANGQGMSRPRAVRDLFRALHTIKGLAGMIGVEPIVNLAHALETLVRVADRAGGNLSPGAVEVALRGISAIAERVRAVAEHRAVADAPESLIEAIGSANVAIAAPVAAMPIPREWEGRLSPSERQQLGQALQARIPVWSLAFTPSDANAARGITIAVVRAELSAIGEIVKVIPRAIAATAETAAGVSFDILIVSEATRAEIAGIVATDPETVVQLAQPTGTSTAAPADVLEPLEPDAPVSTLSRAVVRVELSRLDDLQDQLSLLIVSRFRLEREIVALAGLGHDVRRLREVAQIQGRQLRDLRRAILRARMVRVSEVLELLTLLVRSMSRSSQRIVQLELDASSAELDKAVADRLLPALIHLVRNAVDHAIEPPDHRVALGKPSAGTVRVSCVEVAGNHIEIVVRDDGRGIDRLAIARRANRPIDDDADLLEVLSSPGFSTREVATTTSGRGLGMDIVRRIAVGDLGGEISLTTALGVGTSFTLRVPVTIAVMDVFAFQCGTQSFVVPAVAVDEIFEVEPATLAIPPTTRPATSSLGRRERGMTERGMIERGMIELGMIQRRGHAIPVVSLGAMLAVDSGVSARKALVVRGNGHPIAFTVDRMLGRQEVVVRAIDDPLVNMPGIAGATDLGDGRPTLVLDLNELGNIAREQGLS